MRVKTHSVVFAAIVFFAAFVPAALAQTAKESVSSEDKAFIIDEVGSQLMDVRLGQLAMSRASSEEVKKFGKSVASDQARFGEELRSIAKKKGVGLFSEMPEKNIGKVVRLSGISGPHFDHEYMSLAVEQYGKELEEFKKEAKESQDPDLKSFTATRIPLLAQKLDQAGKIHKKLGGSAGM